MKPEKKLCPHCNARTLPIGRVAGHVVAIMDCPCKEELLVLFQDKVIPLNRSILEEGDFASRKDHLGEIAARVFDWGVRAQRGEAAGAIEFTAEDARALKRRTESQLPEITEEELSKFVRVDLKCLDNANYFRRHFQSSTDD